MSESSECRVVLSACEQKASTLRMVIAGAQLGRRRPVMTASALPARDSIRVEILSDNDSSLNSVQRWRRDEHDADHLALAVDGLDATLHIDSPPQQGWERQEIRDIYATKRFSGDLLDRVVDTIVSNRQTWLATMMDEELHLQPVNRADILRSAFVITVATLIGHLIPLLPFLCLARGPALERHRRGVGSVETAVDRPGPVGVEGQPGEGLLRDRPVPPLQLALQMWAVGGCRGQGAAKHTGALASEPAANSRPLSGRSVKGTLPNGPCSGSSRMAFPSAARTDAAEG